MAGRPLFFLLAQPEDISEITRPLLARKASADKGGKQESAAASQFSPLSCTMITAPQLQGLFVYLFIFFIIIFFLPSDDSNSFPTSFEPRSL
jgi:hypothetical protein